MSLSITATLPSCERRGSHVFFVGWMKHELAGIQEERVCCRMAEAYGLAEFGHAFFHPRGFAADGERGCGPLVCRRPSGRPAGFRCPSRRERACIRPRPRAGRIGCGSSAGSAMRRRMWGCVSTGPTWNATNARRPLSAGPFYPVGP